MRVIGSMLKVILCLAALAAYLRSASLSADKPVHRLMICTDLPFQLVPPFQTGTVDEAGNRGAWISPGAGKGWLGKVGGSATYRFYVPAEDDYTLWGYCLWGDACSNAVFVEADKAAAIVFGNDPLYGQWHWVRGVELHLSRGTHTLRLRNHSDGVKFRQLVLLSDKRERPDGVLDTHYDVFYDGFDGCDGGNFIQWQASAQWSVPDYRQGGVGSRVLEGKATEGSDSPSVAVVGEDAWKDYAIIVSVRAVRTGTLGVCFDYAGPDDYAAVLWQPTSAAESRVEVVSVRGGKKEPAGSLTAPLTLDGFQDVQVSADGGFLTVSVNGKVSGKVPWSGGMRGKAGMLVAQGACAWFDDVHIRCVAGGAAAGDAKGGGG